MRTKNRKIMTIIWIALFVVCSIGVLYTTHKLSQLFSAKENLVNSYQLPDILEFDCKLQIKIPDSLKNEILKRLPEKEKINLTSITMSGYFDKQLIKEDNRFKKNYKIFDKELYSLFENLSVYMNAINGDNSMRLKRNSDNILLTSQEFSGSKILVRELNAKNNTISIEIQNLQLLVESQSLLVADFDKSQYSLHLIFNNQLVPIELSEAFLKTKKMQYYYFKSPLYDSNSGAFSGTLKSQIDFD